MSLMYLVRSVSSLCHETLDRSGGQPLNTINNVRSISPMCLVVLVASRSTSRAPSTRDTTSFLFSVSRYTSVSWYLSRYLVLYIDVVLRHVSKYLSETLRIISFPSINASRGTFD